MRNFNGGGRSQGGFSRNRDSGRRESGRRDFNRSEMFKATCDECGRECEVPFKPTSGKPVYCSRCFESQGQGNRESNRRDFPRKDFGGRDSNRRDFNRAEMFQAVCDQCGNDCEVPFRPSGDKPVYCDNCFGNKGKIDVKHYHDKPAREDSQDRSSSRKSEGSNNDELKRQINFLETKIDKILSLLAKDGDSVPVVEELSMNSQKTETAQKKAGKSSEKKKKASQTDPVESSDVPVEKPITAHEKVKKAAAKKRKSAVKKKKEETKPKTEKKSTVKKEVKKK